MWFPESSSRRPRAIIDSLDEDVNEFISVCSLDTYFGLLDLISLKIVNRFNRVAHLMLFEIVGQWLRLPRQKISPLLNAFQQLTIRLT